MPLITPTQQELINLAGANVPGLADNFREAVAIDPELRPDWAHERLKTVYRDGWHTGAEVGWHREISIEDAETTDQHIEDVMCTAMENFCGAEGEIVAALLYVHDDGEAILNTVLRTQGQNIRRDINAFRAIALGKDAPGVMIKAHKAELEALAIDIIYEDYSGRRALWHDYDRSDADEAQIARSLDKISTLPKCAEYIDGGMRPEEFQAYWEYWTMGRIAETCHSRVTQLYGDVIAPRIQDSINRAHERDKNAAHDDSAPRFEF